MNLEKAAEIISKTHPVDVKRYEEAIEELVKTGKLLLIGPTGSGKTSLVELVYVASALDALEGEDQELPPKLTYILPTQSLIRAKANEFRSLLSNFPHFTPKVSEAYSLSRKEPFSDVLVASYDYYHAFKLGLIGHASRFYQALPELSIKAFDELHVIAQGAKIENLLSHVKASTNVVIMTATLHPEVERVLTEKLGFQKAYLEPFRKNRIKEFDVIDKEQIKDTIEGKTVIFANTVEEAEEIYNTLKSDFDTLLIHGAMTIAEREEAEEQINEKQVIVMTQVGEVGLNIKGLNTVITARAPLENLIQRIGRIRVKGRAFIVKEMSCGPYEENTVKSSVEAVEDYGINNLLDDAELAGKVMGEVENVSLGPIPIYRSLVGEMDRVAKEYLLRESIHHYVARQEELEKAQNPKGVLRKASVVVEGGKVRMNTALKRVLGFEKSVVSFEVLKSIRVRVKPAVKYSSGKKREWVTDLARLYWRASKDMNTYSSLASSVVEVLST
ncbi:helicase-related protein [Pyrococcus kukulkanii]|uniref:Helicase-related protein n=1 Tax=Pyrococcus kukulkanii TaxID=1609559 RepID=A0ABV4T8X9_9EURY